MALRKNEVLQSVNQTICRGVEIVCNIAAHIQHENRDVAMVARQSQQDSRTLKALTTVAIVFLPASLIAVSHPVPSNHCFLIREKGR